MLPHFPSSSPRPSAAPDGLSAEALRRSLEGIPSTLQGMRSPLGEPVRSESVAGMDMLNDMFQRQARRLETQLYQRAQDQRTIELTQRQAQLARAQVRQLEQNHLEHAARISQGAKSLQRLRELIREGSHVNHDVLNVCEALERDASELREVLECVAPAELAKLRSRREAVPSTTEVLRDRVRSLESALAETERSALQQIGVTPLTSVAMSSDCNPLNDLSAVADYASKASVSEGAPPSSSALAAAPTCAPLAPPLPPPPPPSGLRSSPGLEVRVHAPPSSSFVPHMSLSTGLSTHSPAPMSMSPRYASAAPYSTASLPADPTIPVPMSLSRDPSFEQRPY